MRFPVILTALLSVALVGPTPAQELEQHLQSASRGLVGQPAPQVTLETIDGKQIDLGSLYGKKAVYLKFWATWCVPCREQMPHFESTFRKAGPDLEVISINVGFNDTVAQVREFRRKLGLTMATVVDDGRLAGAFNLRVTPQHIVIGRDGRVQFIGHEADQKLETALVAARKAAPAALAKAAPKQTTPKQTTELQLGDGVAHLSTVTVGGDTFKLQDPAAKRPTVVVFFSPWCESYLESSRPDVAVQCRKVREEVTKLGNQDNARWLGIAWRIWSTQNDVRDYRSENHIPFPLALDEPGELFRAFRVTAMPTLFVIDAQGRITHRIEGSDAKVTDTLRSALAR